MEGLEKKHTKTLLKMLRSTYGGRNDDLTDKDVEEIKVELGKREHINTKDQNTLIRKMSQKAGKRLTLKEAQMMGKLVRRRK